MWVPYLALGPLKAESAEETTAAAENDERPRPFLVAFFLELPARREIESDFALAEERVLDLVDLDGRIVRARLCPGRNGRLSEIVFSIEARGAEEALALGWRAVAGSCARWTVASGRGLALSGARIADLEHGARWRILPFQPSTVALPELAPAALRPEHAFVLRAYEEARRGRSVVLRLLAAHRILAAFASSAEPFAGTDRCAAAFGLARAPVAIGRLDLVLADCRALLPEPVPIPLPRVLDWLAPRVERARALLDPRAPIGDGKAWYAFEAERELTGAANLADLLAHRILAEELRLCAELARIGAGRAAEPGHAATS